MKRSSNQKRIPFIVTGRLSAFCFTTTKLTGNEFYCYKIEALQFFYFYMVKLRTLVTTLTSVLSVEISIHRLQCQRITRHSEYIIHESRLYFMSFPDSRSVYGQFTDHPFQTLQSCPVLSAQTVKFNVRRIREGRFE